MKTDVVKPQDVFYNPTRLLVPLFQRPYVWSREAQWEPLWQDIVRLIEVISRHSPGATHFLGAIVIQQVPTALGSLPAWNVIDGQQRLTTLQLLLDALHAQLEHRQLTSLAGRVQALVENPADNRDHAEDRFKLWPTNRDRAAFTEVMAAPSPVDYSAVPTSRLRDAHRFFNESIDEWLADGDEAERRARMLVATVTDRLEIASIRLDPNEDAQAIFETLNARGTPLSAADLIKNYIFQQLPESTAEEAYRQYWAQFETPWWEAEVTSGRIKNPRASLFLWQWLVTRTLEDFPIREVFAQFKYYVSTVSKDVAGLLPQIRAAADRYRDLIEASERPVGPLTRAQLFSYRVNTLDSEIARPILIWLDEPEQGGISDRDRGRMLETLESWFVRRALVKAPSQGSNRFMVDLLQYLSRQDPSTVADSLERYLVANHTAVGCWPGDEEVRAALTAANAYGGYRRARVRMVLEAIEDAHRGYPGANPLAMGPIVRGKATIEHLMPQKWRQHWNDELTDEQATERDRRIQQLGNLTIVTQALNSRVSNGPWPQKRAHFLASDDVLITKDALLLAGDDPWDELAIEVRTDQLIDEVIRLWPAPAGHVGLVTQGGRDPRAFVDLARLIDSGILSAGTQLTGPRRSKYDGIDAVVTGDGHIRIGSATFDTPSGAAASVYTARGAVNGWSFWRIAGTDTTLKDARGSYLDRAEGDAEADAS